MAGRYYLQAAQSADFFHCKSAVTTEYILEKNSPKKLLSVYIKDCTSVVTVLVSLNSEAVTNCIFFSLQHEGQIQTLFLSCVFVYYRTIRLQDAFTWILFQTKRVNVLQSLNHLRASVWARELQHTHHTGTLIFHKRLGLSLAIRNYMMWICPE